MDRLQHPEHYGLSIRKHHCLEGKAPCLLVEPDALAGPGKRGKILRQQLQKQHITLPAYGRVHASIVLLHGRHGRKEDLLPVAERFVAAGFRCILPDLPAHGDSPLTSMSFASTAFEQQLPSAVLSDIQDHFGLPEEPAALWGLSMGGSFAIRAASQQPESWQAMMVVSSFASLETIMRKQVPDAWQAAFPSLISLLNSLRHWQQQPSIQSIQPVQQAADITVPALVVHGDQDNFVPMQQGIQLYQALASPNKRWLSVPNTTHHNVLSSSMPLYAEMSTWLLKTLKPIHSVKASKE